MAPPRRSGELSPNPRVPFKAFRTLRTFTLITTAVLILNKGPSIYALASVITKGSAPESPLQMSMHVYSLVAMILAICLLPLLRRPRTGRTSETRPMALVLLAHLHVVDFLLGIVFTALFASTWFRLIAHPDPAKAGPGAAEMHAGAGFTNPETPVESVKVGTTPTEDVTSPDAEHVIVGINPGSDAAAGNATAGGGASAFGPEGVATMVVMAGLWAVRAYLLACVVLYCRGINRDATARGLDVFERHGWRDVPGRWLARLERGFWVGGDGYIPVKRNRRHSGPSPRQSEDENKEWN